MATQPELLNEGIGIGGEVPHEALASGNGHFNGLTVRYSPTQGKLALALAKAQLAFKPVKKNIENAFFSTSKRKAMYADLSGLIEATQKPLAENELVVLQGPVTDFKEKKAGVVSRLIHSSGEWYEVELLLPATGANGKFDAQTIGSAITYSRKYTYGPAIGVAAEEDDDGNSIGEASGGSKEAAQAVAQRKIAEAQTSVPNSLFWVWHDESQMAELIISQEIKKNVWPFVKRFWQDHAKACVLTGEELESLKYEMEQQGIPFSRLKGNDLTDPLKASIAAAKSKKAREPGEDAK